MHALFVKAVLDDVGQNFLNGDEQVLPKPTPDVVLRGKTFENRIHPKQVFDSILNGDFDFGWLHTEERMRDWSPAMRKIWAVSGATFSSPKLNPCALTVLDASMHRWTKAEAT